MPQPNTVAALSQKKNRSIFHHNDTRDASAANCRTDKAEEAIEIYAYTTKVNQQYPNRTKDSYTPTDQSPPLYNWSHTLVLKMHPWMEI